MQNVAHKKYAPLVICTPFPPPRFSNLHTFPPLYFSNSHTFCRIFVFVQTLLSISCDLKIAFLQEFFKDYSNKKGDFRHSEGEKCPNY